MTQTLNPPQNSDTPACKAALDLVNSGNIQAGSQLLGMVARETRSAETRSLCMYKLAEILDSLLGQTAEAYGLWYQLAHQPMAQQNAYDMAARAKVNALFHAHGLRFKPPDFPPRVQIEVTNRCNLRCIMCTRNQMNRATGDLAWGHFQRVVDECSVHPATGIMLFFLGEPLLHPQIEEMVGYLKAAKQRCAEPITFGIQTNGMLLDKERARRLIVAGLETISFSLDGLEGELEQIRPGAKYAEVERNLLDLLALREELGAEHLQITISKLCDDPEAESVKQFEARWGDKVDAIHKLPITKAAGNAYLDANGEVREIEGSAQPTRRVYCGQGQRLLVLADGRYTFCCSDVAGTFDLGDVDQRSIGEVWNSAEIDAIRRKVVAAEYAEFSACAACPLGRVSDAPVPACQ